MSGSLLLGRDELEGLFRDLDHEPTLEGERVQILMVGGSWLLWFGLRAATRDVDAANRLSEPVCEFVSAGDAVEHFVRAFPHAPSDPHLVRYIEEIAAEAGR